MQKAVDEHLLFLLGIIPICGNFVQNDYSIPVIAVLVALTTMELTIFFEKESSLYLFSAIYVISCFFNPMLVFFCPIYVYEYCYKEKMWGILLCLMFLVNNKSFEYFWQIALCMVLVLLAALLAFRTKRQVSEHREFLKLQDSSSEEKETMQRRNKELLEKQDYEVRVATLSERNRIAREIHDNVGHMLSRCILQLGALMVVNKNNEEVYQSLRSVNDSLNEAMNNIRESVHDLHNESVDLKQSIVEATAEIRKNYSFTFDYDMSENVPREVKYAMIAIVKEAMNNISKHSNATSVSVLLREHPGLYQLLIEDNGTVMNTGKHTGIGLANMKERVETLGGTINFRTDHGFAIYISIVKTVTAQR